MLEQIGVVLDYPMVAILAGVARLVSKSTDAAYIVALAAELLTL